MPTVPVHLVSDDPGWLRSWAEALEPVEDLAVAGRHGWARLELPGEPAAVVADAGSEPQAALGRLAPLLVPGSRLAAVLILRPGQDPAAWYPAAARAGVREVLPADAPLAALCETLYGLAATWPRRAAAPARGAEVVTVFATKGGVGRTTLAVALAVVLARRGIPTLLVDLHLDWGNAATCLGLRPPRPFGELLAEAPRLDGDLLESFLARHASGLALLAAPAKPELADFVTPAHVEAILGAARPLFGALVVDTPAGFPETLQPALAATDQLLLVALPELAALRNARACLRVLDMLQLPRSRLRLVLNQVARGQPIRRADVEATLGVPVWAELPWDPAAARRAASEGVPVPLLAPAGRLARAVEAIALRLGLEGAAAPGRPVVGAARGVLGA